MIPLDLTEESRQTRRLFNMKIGKTLFSMRVSILHTNFIKTQREQAILPPSYGSSYATQVA
jgi:hypothetical protein